MQKQPGKTSAAEVANRRIPKHQVVFEYLHNGILSGVFKPGDRLPSEAALGRTFDASRITVAKALLELQRMNLVTRRPGAGTHVMTKPRAEGYTFGLLIPELGRTEIFEPICHGMMRSPFARPDSLLWPNVSRGTAGIADDTTASEHEAIEQAEHMAHYFIEQRVAAVFFAPLELLSGADSANRRIMRMMERVKMPTVLLDRCYLPYPERSNYDLVGIDNRRTGFQITQHLIHCGAKRLVFLAEPNSASTVDARISGFYEACRPLGVSLDHVSIQLGYPLDHRFVQSVLDDPRPDGIVCANDVTAARMMQTVLSLGRRIPEDIRIVGIDDVRYASLLPVPLTTMRQDCNALGVIAIATMLARMEYPELPVRDILLPTRLVERRSCGETLRETAAP
uniref:Transcriptional regulator, GntR family n=1 Tax=mine drainage metagenome TaxID=410659 RepID=E6QMI3_9ZZZZ